VILDGRSDAMTTRTLVGTYSAGYDLSPAYSRLNITASAFVGGAGVLATGVATVTNHGRIDSGPRAKGGGVGYAGISLMAGGAVANDRIVAGGQGGGAGVVGGAGGAGGIGIEIANAGSVDNNGHIHGGRGGGGGPAAPSELSGAGGRWRRGRRYRGLRDRRQFTVDHRRCGSRW